MPEEYKAFNFLIDIKIDQEYHLVDDKYLQDRKDETIMYLQKQLKELLTEFNIKDINITIE